MNTEIIVALIALATSVIVAIIEAVATKDRKRAKEEMEKSRARAELRAEESRLAMQMMDATMQLSIANCNALCGGHNNGNVEEAKEAAKRAQANYHNFLAKIATETVVKI